MHFFSWKYSVCGNSAHLASHWPNFWSVFCKFSRIFFSFVLVFSNNFIWVLPILKFLSFIYLARESLLPSSFGIIIFMEFIFRRLMIVLLFIGLYTSFFQISKFIQFSWNHIFLMKKLFDIIYLISFYFRTSCNLSIMAK